jgi:hypothetical protein
MILASLIIINCTACASSEQSGDETGSETESEAQSTAETEIPDNLPDNLNFDGETIHIIARDWEIVKNELYVESETGDIVDSAVYKRNLNTEEQLNVDLDYYLTDDVEKTSSQSILAMADDYQIVAGWSLMLDTYGQQNMYHNVLDGSLKYLDVTQPWWSQYYIDGAKIGNKCFFVTGDLATSFCKLSFVTFYNKTVAENYGITDLYDCVTSGEWTISKQEEYIKNVYSDVNGDNVADQSDIYGLGVSNVLTFDVFWSAFDIHSVIKSSDGTVTLNDDMSKIQSCAETVYDLFYNNPNVLDLPVEGGNTEQNKLAGLLASDNLLFAYLRVIHTESDLRGMQSDYGIMPLPKWDEAQTNYYTYVHDQFTSFGIPVTCVDTDAASATLELLAVNSYRYVTPAYYNIALNGKYLRDTESSEMLEIAMDGISLDFGWLHSASLDFLPQVLFRNPLNSKSTNISSVYASKQKYYTKLLQDLCDTYASIN